MHFKRLPILASDFLLGTNQTKKVYMKPCNIFEGPIQRYSILWGMQLKKNTFHVVNHKKKHFLGVFIRHQFVLPCKTSAC